MKICKCFYFIMRRTVDWSSPVFCHIVFTRPERDCLSFPVADVARVSRLDRGGLSELSRFRELARDAMSAAVAPQRACLAKSSHDQIPVKRERKRSPACQRPRDRFEWARRGEGDQVETNASIPCNCTAQSQSGLETINRKSRS